MLRTPPYVTMAHEVHPRRWLGLSSIALAGASGRSDDLVARDLGGEDRMLQTVVAALGRRVGQGIMSGKMSDQSSAVARLFGGVTTARRINIGYDLAGAAGAAWSDDDGAAGGLGSDFLIRPESCLGRGTNEMARNVVTTRRRVGEGKSGAGG